MGNHITKEHEKWHSKDWCPYYDSCVCDFLAKNKMAVFSHLSFSPDLTPRDFLLLPELNTALKGRGGSDITFLQAELWNRLSKFQTVNFANASNSGALTGLTA
jgi:hypothetical protein